MAYAEKKTIPQAAPAVQKMANAVQGMPNRKPAVAAGVFHATGDGPGALYLAIRKGGLAGAILEREAEELIALGLLQPTVAQQGPRRDR